jgi:hypothetical protein
MDRFEKGWADAQSVFLTPSQLSKRWHAALNPYGLKADLSPLGYACGSDSQIQQFRPLCHEQNPNQ